MIRQINTTTTKPFKKHIIADNTIIKAADFDMGRQRYAYYDKDSARYQYTPGVNTEGNKGYSYRNDGVDIRIGNDGPYVCEVETGEWLQYTVTVSKAGEYDISFITAAEKEGSSLSLEINNTSIINDLALPVTAGMQRFTATTVKHISLQKGTSVLKLITVKGGYNLSGIQFEKKK